MFHMISNQRGRAVLGADFPVVDWRGVPLETYIFILNFLLPLRSEQVSGAHVNEIKHDHSPIVIVVLDARYD